MQFESVCAIVPTFNRRDLLSRCLQALCSQTQPLDHILLIDNASTDGTAEFVAGEFPQVEILRLPVNLGSAGGFCEGVRSAYLRGFDWIWFVDDDALVAEDALEALVRFSKETMPKRPPRYVLGPVRLWESDRTFAGLPAMSWNLSNPFLRFERARIPLSARYRSYAELPPSAEVKDLAWEGMLVPREAVRSIGLPSSGYFTQAEDTDYSFRLRRAGYRLLMVSASRLYRMIQPDENVPIASWKARYFVRNRIWLNRLYAENSATRVLRSWLWAARHVLANVLKLNWLRNPERMKAFYTGAREGLWGMLPQGEPAPSDASVNALLSRNRRR